MSTETWDTALAVAAIVLATNAVGAVAAYGGSLLALPLLALVFHDLSLVKPILLTGGAVQSWHLAWANRHHLDQAWFRRILGWVAVGLPAGHWASQALPEGPLLWAMALVLMLGAGVPLLKPEASLPPRLARYAVPVLFWLGGLFHGAFAAGGGPIVVAAREALPEKDRFRATMFLFWATLNTGFLIVLCSLGQASAPGLGWAAWGIPFFLLGGVWGQAWAGRLDQRRFQRWVGAMLVLAAALTAWRAANG